MKKLHEQIPSNVLLPVILSIMLLSSTPLGAQEEAEEVKPVIRSNLQIKTIDPSIRKELVKPQVIQPDAGQLSPTEYQAIIRAHNARVQAVAVKPSARAVTTLKSQNSTFRGEYDCDDQNRQAYPGASEICDGIDNDCDGDIDENVTNRYYLDADGDSWGDSARTYLACDTPSGYASRPNDCDDTNLVIYPGASDNPGNGIDENCNGHDG